MTDATRVSGLTQAVQRYLDLMYDGDVSRFDQVFASTSQLHGLREGKIAMLTAAGFKDLIGNRKSPKALGAPREEAILMLDFASPTQALAKVRVRIAQTQYVDYLVYHLIDGAWLVTAKGFHIERVYPTATAAAAA
jgi:hypothetical protein